MRTRISSVDSCMGKITEEFSDIKIQLRLFQEERTTLTTAVKELKRENAPLIQEMGFWKSEVTELQQYTRSNNLLITGVPQSREEDVYEVIQHLAEVLSITYLTSDISIAHRLSSRQRDENPPSIVVQFTSRLKNMEWNAAAKRKKLLTSTELRGSLATRNTYINEHLTTQNGELFNVARHMTRIRKLAYAWVKPTTGESSSGTRQRAARWRECGPWTRTTASRMQRQPRHHNQPSRLI